MEKKWYDDWIEVFKTGEHTDSAGNTRQWTEQDIDNIVASYNPQNHEAPIVLGHPKDNHPAYGWVEAVKREGGKLKVKLIKLLPEFKEWVEKGLYRKISVALSPEFGLRHVGFLGAVPPAIKGLQHAFSRGLGEIEIENSTAESGNMSKTALPVGFEGAPTGELNYNTAKGGNMSKKGEEMKHSDNGTFAQQIAHKDRQIQQLILQQEKSEFTQFAQDLNQQGKIPACYKEIVVDILNTLGSTDGCFCDANHQRATIEGFKHLLNSMKPMCEFEEFATKDSVAQGTLRLPEEDLGLRMAKSANG